MLRCRTKLARQLRLPKSDVCITFWQHTCSWERALGSSGNYPSVTCGLALATFGINLAQEGGGGGGGGRVLPYMGYIGMCGPKGYGLSGVLVINRVSILAVLIVNRV